MSEPTLAMSEKEQAVKMANRALDVPWSDPDDDLRTISRQFLRAIEREEKVAHFHARAKALADKWDRYSRWEKVNGLTIPRMAAELRDLLGELK
jgi:hypothetical protein